MCCAPSLRVSERHNPLSERSTLIPDVDYGRENCDVKHKALVVVKTLARTTRRTHAQTCARSQVALVSHHNTHPHHARRTRPRTLTRRSMRNVGWPCEIL